MTYVIYYRKHNTDLCIKNQKKHFMKVSKSVFLFLLILSFTKGFSQFTIDAELRPRFEYRHGYKTLFPDNADPATFVSQRTRLNFGYKTEKLHFYLSPQDVRVWGDVPQLNVADENGFSLHQAWADVLLTSDLSLKIGRQEIIYDDQRFFGNVGWAQQGRSHDAAILKYEPSFLKFHFGAAYNQDGEALTGNILTTNTYKSLQYLWLHKDWEQLSASFLFVNNGLQYIDEIDESKKDKYFLNLQTINNQIKQIENLVNEFSDFARMPKPMFKNNNLYEIINLNVELLKKIDSEINIDFKYEKNKKLIFLCDYEQISRVFFNLIKNSIESIHERQAKNTDFAKKISIVIISKNDYIEFIITDNGTGFSESNLKNILKPYFTTKSKGSGLGLSIVNKIINDHNGTINFKHQKDGGSTIIRFNK